MDIYVWKYFINIVYVVHVTPTRGHPQGGALQRMGTPRYQQKFVNQCTDVEYWVLRFVVWSTYFLICILNLSCIFKTLCFTSVHWFKNFCNISMYPSCVTHLPDDGSGDWNMLEVYYVYNILSYTYMRLLLLLPYLIAQCMVMDH